MFSGNFRDAFKNMGILIKRCSKTIQQIYRRTNMSSMIPIKLVCNFVKIILGMAVLL